MTRGLNIFEIETMDRETVWFETYINARELGFNHMSSLNTADRTLRAFDHRFNNSVDMIQIAYKHEPQSMEITNETVPF